ncbi:MAG: hypothetical protein K9N07_07295 [Candidatus Cloacimonetes bacterium]|nr:hypothetical protein [Candidatus Cloacimonadota bacterium]
MKKILIGIVIGVILSVIVFLIFYKEHPVEADLPVEEANDQKTYEDRLKEYYAGSPYAEFYDSENIMNKIFADHHNPQPSNYIYRETLLEDYNGESYIYIFFRKKEYRDHNEPTFHAFRKTYGVAEYMLMDNDEYKLTTLTLNIGRIPTNNVFPGYEIVDVGPGKMAFQLEISDLGMATYVTTITLITKVGPDFKVVFQETITTYQQKELIFVTDKISQIEYEFWISKKSITNGYYDLFLKLQGIEYEGEDLEKIEVDKLIKYSFNGSSYQVNESPKCCLINETLSLTEGIQ